MEVVGAITVSVEESERWVKLSTDGCFEGVIGTSEVRQR